MNARLQDLPIAVKVALAPALVLVCLLVLAAVGRTAQQRGADAMQRLSGGTLPYMQSVSELKVRTARLDAMVMRSLAYEGAGMKAKRVEQIDKAIAAELVAFGNDLATMKRSAVAADKAHFEAIEQVLARFRRFATDTIDMKSGGLSAAAMMMTSAESEFRNFEKAVDTLVSAVEARERSATEAALADMRSANVATLGLVLAAVVFSLAVIWASVRMITLPLAEAVRIARRVAEGDLTVAVHSQRRDEVGQVLRAMAQVGQRLGALMAQVRRAANEIETAAGEIASANTDLSVRTETTANSLQQTAQTVDHLAAQTAGNGDNAAKACRLASDAADVARQGGLVVGDVVTAMTRINADAQRIRDIIGVIDGIAFQTNILALNAAVEAARAGEQGRGFAVVAGEVRTLAQRSAASAREIRTLISASVEQVEAGSAKVGSASASMTRVVDAVHEVLRLVSEMAQAGAEQARGVAEVNEAVSSMDHSTQQNAAMVEQAAAATLSLKQQADELMRSLAVFRLEPAAA
jgi:methyl-accepting chemotaxis protein